MATLVDVRENAISRKAGLSKKALASRCETNGIAYVHEPRLGTPATTATASGPADPRTWR